LGKTAGRDVDRSISIIIEAEKKKDAEICNKIYPFSFFPSNLTIFLLGCETANNFLMDSYEGCITQVAIAKNDISLCKKLYPYTKDIYVNDIESCQNRVLTGVSDAHYFCKSWRVDVIGHPPSECYIKIALKTENYKVCKNIEDADMFNECIYRVAAKTDNIELCKELNQEGFYYKRGVYDNCEEDIKNKIKSKIGF